MFVWFEEVCYDNGGDEKGNDEDGDNNIGDVNDDGDNDDEDDDDNDNDDDDDDDTSNTRKGEVMMTIFPARNNSNDAANDTKGDVTNNDVIMTMPTSVMVMYNSGDNEELILKEIIKHCTTDAFFKCVI